MEKAAIKKDLPKIKERKFELHPSAGSHFPFFNTFTSMPILFTDDNYKAAPLYPLTLTRRISELRLGILTIQQKWERLLGQSASHLWQGDYLDTEESVKLSPDMLQGNYLLLSGNLLPNPELVEIIKQLRLGQCLMDEQGGALAIAFKSTNVRANGNIRLEEALTVTGGIARLEHPWQLFQWNTCEIHADVELLTNGRKSGPISNTNRVINPQHIFLEPGAVVEYALLNASEGPIYIGKNALVMEGCLLRGPIALCEGTVLKMGTKVYGGTTLGPYCTGGGEIKNSLLLGFSNKAHDGYLGDSVIGEWCNLGAGTSNSNVKNNAGEVRYGDGPVIGNKGGLLMGDYSKAAINTAFNTATTVGVCANVFGSGLTPKQIPNFAWGMDRETQYGLEKALTDIDNWKKMKGHALTDSDKKILKHIFAQSS